MDLKVNGLTLESGRRLVEIALVSEVRTLSLNEFTSFWLDMVEISRRETPPTELPNGAQCTTTREAPQSRFTHRKKSRTHPPVM